MDLGPYRSASLSRTPVYLVTESEKSAGLWGPQHQLCSLNIQSYELVRPGWVREEAAGEMYPEGNVGTVPE